MAWWNSELGSLFHSSWCAVWTGEEENRERKLRLKPLVLLSGDREEKREVMNFCWTPALCPHSVDISPYYASPSSHCHGEKAVTDKDADQAQITSIWPEVNGFELGVHICLASKLAVFSLGCVALWTGEELWKVVEEKKGEIGMTESKSRVCGDSQKEDLEWSKGSWGTHGGDSSTKTFCLWNSPHQDSLFWCHAFESNNFWREFYWSNYLRDRLSKNLFYTPCPLPPTQIILHFPLYDTLYENSSLLVPRLKYDICSNSVLFEIVFGKMSLAVPGVIPVFWGRHENDRLMDVHSEVGNG